MCQKSPWYERWHRHPNRSTHHRRTAYSAGLVSLVAIAISALKYAAAVSVVASLAIHPNSALAAGKTWTTQSDWGDWTLSSTTATTNPGSIQLTSTSGGSSLAWSDVAAAPLNDYTAVWAADSTHVWFGVDVQPYIIYYNGSTFAQQTIPNTTTVNAIWGTSTSDVWAVANDGLIFHYNGTSWSLSGSPTVANLKAVWGAATNDVWVAGNSGWFAHYDGSSWTANQVSNTFAVNAMFGFSSTNIWAAGSDGNPYHYDGSSWTAYASPSIGALTGVWGSASDNVWFRSVDYMKGTNGLGGVGSWSPVENGLHDNSCTVSGNLWGFTSTDMWAPCKASAVLHNGGSGWATVSTPAGTVIRLHGASASDIWGITNGGDIYHYADTSSPIYSTSGTASITYTPAAGQQNDWTTASATTTTPTNTTLTLEYSADNSNWFSSLGSVPSSTSLYIRASLGTSDTAITPTLDALTVSYDAITATSTAPTSGSSIRFNSTSATTNITWSATGTAGVDHIRLQYSTNGGSSWSDITGATNLDKSTTSFSWNMPDISSSTVQTKILLETASNTALASSTSGNFTLDYDTTAPTLTVTATTNNANTAQAKTGDVITISVSSNENLTAAPTVTVGGLSTSCTGSNTSFTCTRTVASSDVEGLLTVSATGTDLASNSSTDQTKHITIDHTAPIITVTTPSSNPATVSEASLTVRGTASDNVTLLSLTSSDRHTLTGTSLWEQPLTLTSGENTVTYTATDAAGNSTTLTLTITYTPVVATTVSAPTKPQNVRGQAKTGNITLTFTPPITGEAVRIWRSTSPNSVGDFLIESTAGQYVDEQVAADTTYYYTFVTVRQSDQVESGVVTVKTLYALAVTPTVKEKEVTPAPAPNTPITPPVITTAEPVALPAPVSSAIQQKTNSLEVIAPVAQAVVVPLTAAAIISTAPTVFAGSIQLLNELLSRFASGLANALQALAVFRRQKNVGKVLNRRSKQPVVGATVTIMDPASRRPIETQRTDSDGQYMFLSDPHQAYILAITAPDFLPQEIVVRGFNLHRIIRLGLPLENDTMGLLKRQRWERAFTVLNRSRVALLILGTAAWLLVISEYGGSLANYLLGAYYLIAWGLEGYISRFPKPIGVVTDKTTGQPLPQVVVRIFNATDNKLVATHITTTDGRFKALLQPGRYNISYSKNGYNPITNQGMVFTKTIHIIKVDAAMTRATDAITN